MDRRDNTDCEGEGILVHELQQIHGENHGHQSPIDLPQESLRFDRIGIKVDMILCEQSQSLVTLRGTLNLAGLFVDGPCFLEQLVSVRRESAIPAGLPCPWCYLCRWSWAFLTLSIRVATQQQVLRWVNKFSAVQFLGR